MTFAVNAARDKDKLLQTAAKSCCCWWQVRTTYARSCSTTAAVHCSATAAAAAAAKLLGQDHLLAVQDPQHKYLRGLIMPAFTPDSIASLAPRMVAVLGRYLERWGNVC
jgi:cytochrome P450